MFSKFLVAVGFVGCIFFFVRVVILVAKWHGNNDEMDDNQNWVAFKELLKLIGWIVVSLFVVCQLE